MASAMPNPAEGARSVSSRPRQADSTPDCPPASTEVSVPSVRLCRPMQICELSTTYTTLATFFPSPCPFYCHVKVILTKVVYDK